MKFSQRNGYSAVNQQIIREELTAVQRTTLWNGLKTQVWDRWGVGTFETRKIDDYLEALWLLFFKNDLDSLPRFKRAHGLDAYGIIKDYFFQRKWFEVLDFLEFSVVHLSSLLNDKCCQLLNKLLEIENSAYRIVGKQIVEITDENELAALREALQVPPSAVKNHLGRALELLSDRTSPDYRNSIKESISAVEAACRRITGDSKATLGKALKKVVGLHPSMERGFSALYGFSSDEGGIRHALSEESAISYEDAKYMLVTCAAFCNFLEATAAREGA